MRFTTTLKSSWRRWRHALSPANHQYRLLVTAVNITVPVCNLPFELLQEILLLSVNAKDWWQDPLRSNAVTCDHTCLSLRFLIGLSHVCQYWRAVAIASSALWSDMCTQALLLRRWTKIARMFLDRTKLSMLRVCLLERGDQHGRLEPADYDRFVVLIVSRQNPWRSLTMSNFPQGINPLLVRLVNARALSSLQTVDFSASFPSSNYRHVGSSLAFQRFVQTCVPALQLTSLVLEYAFVRTDMLIPTLRCLKLYSCQLTPLPEFLTSLGTLKRLETVHVGFSSLYGDLHRGDPLIPVILPNLKNLSIRIGHHLHDGTFLNLFTCAALRSFSLENMSGPFCPECFTNGYVVDAQPLDDLMDVVLNKGWTLDTLCIHGCAVCTGPALSQSMNTVRRMALNALMSWGPDICSLEHLPELLKFGVALEELALSCWDIDDINIILQAIHSHAPQILGQLCTLYVGDVGQTGVSWLGKTASPVLDPDIFMEKLRERLAWLEDVELAYFWPSWAST